MPDPLPARIGLAAPSIPNAGAIATPEDLDEDATALDVVRAALAPSVARLLRQDPAIRRGDDPEAIHAARVAVRRVRSHLRTFRRFLDREPADELRRELRWLGRALGEVRDAEVLGERLRGRLAGLAGEPPELAPLLEELENRRASERHSLLAAMRSVRYVDLVEHLAAWAAEPRGRAGRAQRPARRALAVMERPWAQLADGVRRLGPDPRDEQLHRVRIQTKRVRYAAEALALVAGKPATRFAAKATELQDVLGEHQDAVAAIRWLGAHGRPAGDPLLAFGAGRLAEVEWEARAQARADWPDAWRSLERRKRFWN